MVPRKANAKVAVNTVLYISLMSYTLKILLKIIHFKVYKKLECNISVTQFGFRNGVCTREVIFALNVLTQRYLNVNQDIYMCFRTIIVHLIMLSITS